MKLLEPEQRVFMNVKVENVTVISEKMKFDGSTNKICECIVGDSFGCAILLARNEQLDIVKEGETI